MWSSLNSGPLGASLAHFMRVNIRPHVASSANWVLRQDGWTGVGMAPWERHHWDLPLSVSAMFSGPSWSPEQPVLVIHSLFLSQQLGHYCGCYASDLLPPMWSHNRSHKGRLILLVVCVTSFIGWKFQTHSRHLMHVCHSILPTTPIPR